MGRRLGGLGAGHECLATISYQKVTRILQIHTRYREPGGEDVVADAERRLLEASGHEVVTVRCNSSDSSWRAAVQLASYAWNPISAATIMKVAKETQPDIAHFHNTWFAVSPTVLRSLKRAGIPTVVTIHNYRLMCANAQLMRNGAPCELCVGVVPWRAVQYRCYRDSSAASMAAGLGVQVHRSLGTWKRGVDQFLAPTEFLRERLIAAGLPEERIVVHPNFVADPGPRAEPPSASRRVVYVGRLSDEKGLAVALEAWRRASLRGLEFAIVGDGPQREDLVRNADDSVSFLGRLSQHEVHELLLTSRAMVSPSLWYEVHPLAVLEAFAAGVPVLGSAIGGLGEAIAPLGSQWGVVPGSIDAWTSALTCLVDDAIVEAGSTTARHLFETRYSTSIARRNLGVVYNRVLMDPPS